MNQERLLKIILSPHLSEKSTREVEKNNTHAFRVINNANKYEIKNAIELIFNVSVKAVRIVTVKAKEKMFRNVKGRKQGWKKAYVTLSADQTINMVNEVK